MMWGKFCHSCFEITGRTALAQFGHFTLKTRVRFQKGGFRSPKPPLGAPLYSDITPKRLTSGGVHLCSPAPQQHNSEETSLQWRAVGDFVYDLIDWGIEPTTRTVSDVFNHQLASTRSKFTSYNYSLVAHNNQISHTSSMPSSWRFVSSDNGLSS